MREAMCWMLEADTLSSYSLIPGVCALAFIFFHHVFLLFIIDNLKKKKKKKKKK
jgi:hypothetical protein